MLTNDDLRKIGNLIDERLELKLEEKFEQKLQPIKKDVKSLKNSHRKLRKDFSIILKHLDGARVSHEKRITRLEDHLHLLH